MVVVFLRDVHKHCFVFGGGRKKKMVEGKECVHDLFEVGVV